MKTFYIILAFCIGLFAGYVLFNKPTKTLKPPLENIHPATEVIAAVDSSKSNAERALKRQNDFLKGQLTITDTKLKQNRASLEQERKKLRLVQVELQADSLCCDKMLKDSLTQRVDAVQVLTDSLFCEYEERIRLTEKDCALRDSGIVICNRAYNQLKDLAKEQAFREQQLTERLNEALRQQRRKRLQNRFLAGGMLFVSGVATSLFLHAKQ